MSKNALIDMASTIILPGDVLTYDIQDTMEFPGFSLSKKKRTKTIHYEKDKEYINHRNNKPYKKFMKVYAREDIGMATIWDADILIWAGSKIRDAIKKGKEITRKISCHPHTILEGINRGTSGRDYLELRSAMDRLHFTSVETNIRHTSNKASILFNWIPWRLFEETLDNKPIRWEFLLPEWYLQGIIDPKLILSVDPDYYHISSGIERWLYRLMRKAAGMQPNGAFYSFESLYKASASTSEFKKFSFRLRQIALKREILNYKLELIIDKNGKENLHFMNKDIPKIIHITK